MKFDILTFGSVSLDVLIESEKLIVEESKKPHVAEVHIELGEKIRIKNVEFSVGGGGSNSAATFAKQGFKVAFLGKIGNDLFGKEIIKDLKKRKIKSFLGKSKKKTNFSVILSTKEGRTIFAFRGASNDLQEKDLKKIPQVEWFYLAPLCGEAKKLTQKIVSIAKKRKIKVFLNPSKEQLLLKEINEILKNVDILLLNQEESAYFTKMPLEKEKEIFLKILKKTKGVFLMTKGKEGVLSSDGKFLYSAEALEGKIVDRTGAGDAFGSGFLCGWIKGKKKKLQGKDLMIYALQFASANAISCLSKYGAKEGLLSKKDSIYKFGKIKVKIEKL